MTWILPLFFFCTSVVFPAFAQLSDEPQPTPEDVELVIKKRDYSDAEIKLLQELEQRRIQLDRQEQALSLRERLSDLAEERLIVKIKSMQALQASLEGLLKNLSGKEEEELRRLAGIYEVMKPASAAEILNRLENSIVFDLFRRMKKKNTAKIMGKMKPAKARVISEMLAEKQILPAFGMDK